jgi:hypothetical protein
MRSLPSPGVQRSPLRLLTALAGLAMIWALLPGAAAASDLAGTFTASFAPSVIATAGSQSLSLTISNDTASTSNLTWIGIIAPSGYQITGIGGSDPAVNGDGSRAKTTLSVAPGSSASISVTVTPPAGCSSTADAWSVYAENENLNVSAFPDDTNSLNTDDFTPYPTTPATTVQNACSLQFVNQPTTTVKGDAITDASFSSGAPIQVEIVDGGGNLVSTASASISLAANGGPGSLQGTTTVATSGGIATFTGVSIDQDGTYTLAASATGLTPTTSQPFDIVDGGSACQSGSSCSASATGGTGGSTNLSVTGAAGGSGLLTISFTGTIQCTGPFGRLPYQSTSATFTVDLTTNASKTFDLTISRAAALAAGKPFAFQYHVCFNAPNDFRQLLGPWAPADATNGGYTGLLPGCLTLLTDDIPGLPRANSGPCVIWKVRDAQGNIHIRFFAPAGDPRGYS